MDIRLETLQLIHQTSNSLIYYCSAEQCETPLTIKVLNTNYPTANQLVHFNNEYEFTKDLNIEGVRKAIKKTHINSKPALVLEYFAGETVKKTFVENKQDLIDFLKIAIQIAQTLSQIHQHNIIHRDINSSNILVNLSTHTIKIIDFGLSSRIDLKRPHLGNPKTLEGTLAYISPEQTGRMNRVVDYRTDLYSLGVTLYEMLTGQLPFQMDKPMALVHAHIAKECVSPYEIGQKGKGKVVIPRIVSDIIMKLMAKNAEDRYQSAHGLQVDLETCLTNLTYLGYISDFKPAQHDYSRRFQLPQKLYGRKYQIKSLITAIEQITAIPPPKPLENEANLNTDSNYLPDIEDRRSLIDFILVTGYSGVGKSAMVNELYKPITQKQGFFITGKYDQYQQNSPYSAFTQAFNEFCDHLLIETNEILTQWKTKILTAVGNNIQLLIKVIPHLQWLIGDKPAASPLDGQVTQSQFNTVFKRFIDAISQPNHPIILFIDDLQWVDEASLNLLKTLIINDNPYFLIIGAYRDNEVSSAHPLRTLIDELEDMDLVVNIVKLTDLTFDQVNQLLADTFQTTPHNTQTLTDLIYAKTYGNPFFTRAFLQSLYEDGLLTFDINLRKWKWVVSEIKARTMTDNVVELLTEKVKKLSKTTQTVLQLAACIGNQFNLQLLATIYKHTPLKTLQDLWQAVEEGIITPLDDNYKFIEVGSDISDNTIDSTFTFLHNNIQQAVYSLINATIKSKTHLEIGRLLLKNNTDAYLDEYILSVVDHLNMGITFIQTDEEYLQLAELNFAAGQKANQSAAYDSALNYLTVAKLLLRPSHWQTHYNLMLNLQYLLANVAYLNGLFEKSHGLIYEALVEVNTSLEKIKLYKLLIIQHTALGQFSEAIQVAKEGLNLLNIRIPHQNLQSILSVELAKTQELWQYKEINTLVTKPELTDVNKKAALDLLTEMLPAAYFLTPILWQLIVLKTINFSLTEGYSENTAICYAHYAIFLESVLENHEAAYEFSIVALKLTERFTTLNAKAKVNTLLGGSVYHWHKPLLEITPFLTDGYQNGLDSGNLQYAGYTLVYTALTSLFKGNRLRTVFKDILNFLTFNTQNNNQWAIDVLSGCQLILANLTGQTTTRFNFDYIPSQQTEQNKALLETDYLTHCTQQQSFTPKCIYHIFKAQVLYLYGDFESALNEIELAKKQLQFILGLLPMVDYIFYQSLILISIYPKLPASKRALCCIELEINQAQLKTWADNVPSNFLHKYYLVAAEYMQLMKQDLQAMNLYDKAIETAKKNEFTQDYALANELAAKFWLKRDKESFATLYLTEAHYQYQLWGANFKVKDLQAKYRFLLPVNKLQSTTTTIFQNTVQLSPLSATQSRSNLDTMSIMQAAQAISSEIDLDKLLATLIKTIIQNAGAQRGYLILKKDDVLSIESTWEITQTDTKIRESTVIDTLPPIQFPVEIVKYVARSESGVVLNDVRQHDRFNHIPYVIETQPKSILCIPLINQAKLLGIIYLENNLTTYAFTNSQVETVGLLATQAAISITNAQIIESRAERQQLKLEREFHKQQAAELAKINADKDKFFSIVAHDLRGPFTPLLARLERLTEDIDLLQPIEIKKIGQSLYLSAQGVYNLLENLLEWSRMQRGRMIYSPNKVDLTQLINQNIELLNQIAINKKVALYTPLKQAVFVQADEYMLNTIIRNLISNALKFTPPQGQVVVLAQLIDQFIEVAVADTGVGINEEAINKLFQIDQHYTTLGTNQEQGTGLGLIICKEMVEKNKGTIHIESELGKGATVKFTIPVDPDSLHLIPPLVDSLDREQIEQILSPKIIKPQRKKYVLPPKNEMIRLFDLAMEGDMQQIIQRTHQFKTLNEQYIPFANELQRLANNFEDEALLELLEEVMLDM